MSANVCGRDGFRVKVRVRVRVLGRVLGRVRGRVRDMGTGRVNLCGQD